MTWWILGGLAALLIILKIASRLRHNRQFVLEPLSPNPRKHLVQLAPRPWLLESIRYFRSLGFYEERQQLSDDQLADHLEREHGRAFDPKDKIADIWLLQFDKRRVWWQDLEMDVCNGNEVYVQTLPELARISRGAMVVDDIQEIWKGEQGPISVVLKINGIKRTIEPEYNDDWFDADIVYRINEWISATGMKFRVYEAFDQTAFIVVLSDDEASRLEKERGWKFCL